MEHLKKELKDLQEWIEEESRKASELEGNLMNQREKIHSTFEHLKQFLEQEKQQLLSRLEKEKEENMKMIQEKLAQLEKQKHAHKGLITELERKCQQQDVELLKDVKSILGRCSEVKAQKPQENASAMKTTLQSTRRHAHLQEKLIELKETFSAEIEWRYLKSCEYSLGIEPSFDSLLWMITQISELKGRAESYPTLK
ncbi:E3 ubiquitin-protein ligase TRIM17-like [Ambystoma mexicanum]|uniref:E3 ubiquitin-protein ligase TRIM17-like n=1 Tax=Ambystoma mexicanum TaxID=8296 RepID=UPI0037E929AD